MEADSKSPNLGQTDGELLELIAEFDRRISHPSFSRIAKNALDFLVERLGARRASVALLAANPNPFPSARVGKVT